MSPDEQTFSAKSIDNILEDLNGLSDKDLLYFSSFHTSFFELEQLKSRFKAISEDYDKRSSVLVDEAHGGEAIAALFELLIMCPFVLENPLSFEWVRGKLRWALNKQRWHKEYHKYFWEAVQKAHSTLEYDRLLIEDTKAHDFVDYYMTEKGLSKNAAVRRVANEFNKDERHIHRALKRYHQRKPL